MVEGELKRVWRQRNNTDHVYQNHNDLVYEEVLPHIKNDTRAVKWLRLERDATRVLARQKRGTCGHIGWPW